MRSSSKKLLEIYNVEDPDSITAFSKDQISTLNNFMKKVKHRVVQSRQQGKSVIDIEGEMIGMADGIQGQNKFKLEKAVDIDKYVKRNFSYFKEQESLKRQYPQLYPQNEAFVDQIL